MTSEKLTFRQFLNYTTKIMIYHYLSIIRQVQARLPALCSNKVNFVRQNGLFTKIGVDYNDLWQINCSHSMDFTNLLKVRKEKNIGNYLAIEKT